MAIEPVRRDTLGKHSRRCPCRLRSGPANADCSDALADTDVIQNRNAMSRISTPITVITGFLGAGKTTLINRILAENHGERLAIIENEFGETGVDAEFLIAQHDETVIQLANGCVCCTVRGDLANALNQLAQQKSRNDISFDRVIIETTGMADPGPILQTFLAETAILSHYHLDGIVALVDAFHGDAQLAVHIENRAQVAYADRLLISKTDLVSESALAQLQAHLHQINPRAPILHLNIVDSRLGDVMQFMFDARAYAFDYIAPEDLKQLQTASLFSKPDGRFRPLKQRHTEGVVSTVFTSNHPLDLERLNGFIDAATERYGTNLWRCKGVVYAENHRMRLIVQGVQKLIQISGGTMWRPYQPKSTILVFIGQDLDPDWLAEGLTQCEADTAQVV
ncbi:CobW family GTP-binding protein [Neopusillimonas aromaticivorans]|uniref:CobW family GTP-binding protein n=1 Tax=Neopusillimonas aromaticivorans TaxID=2979868 RepID=UPI002591CFBB|nr:GTP-binding protein [Neopusillimonas aromaticivorans]WJJ93954.1 GTP-binding protein [Neopusillimonas aromaticivorans]